MLQRLKTMKHKVGRIVLPDSPSASSVPFVEYLKWYRFTRFTPKHPLSVDIQTRSGCNAHCTFCPVGREQNKINGAMSDDFFHHIVDEIMSYPNLRQINPYLLNDPLVDKNIAQKIEYITKKRGKNKHPIVRIITNAGLLNEEIAYQLLRSGLDEINLSFHSIQPDVYEEMMPPLKFDKVMDNILKLVELRNAMGSAKKPNITVWTVRTKPVETNLENEKAYWKKLKVEFKARKMDNRADPNIEGKNFSAAPFEPVIFCPIPFWRAWVMWNGDLIMCCVDQERTCLLGNCTNRSIQDIWNDVPYQQLRAKWRKKRLDGLLCKTCKGT